MSEDKHEMLMAHLECDLSSQNLGEVQQFAANALLTGILKKNTDVRKDDAAEKAKTLFLECNNLCKNYRLELRSSWEQQIVGQMRDYLARWTLSPSQDPFSLSMIFENSDFGPGASRGTRHTSYLQKIAEGRLTATSPHLVAMWEDYCKVSVRSHLAETARKAKYGPAVIIKGSKFTTVPKSWTIDRGIATEPSLNMFFQKGFARCLERSIKIKTGIDLEQQQVKAKRLAQIGSKLGTFGTIDLKSASDTISIRLVHELFPKQVCTLVDMTRSKYCKVDDKEVKLYMAATMGCGWTFILQTAIFASLVLSVYSVMGINPEYPRGKRIGNFSVFGDDIIVDTKVFGIVCHMLRVLGMIPNEGKSFNDGFFRESCGGDYYRGKHVRAVYNRSLSQPHLIYSTINLLMVWSARHSIALTGTIGYLKSLIKKPVYILPILPFGVSDGIWVTDLAENDFEPPCTIDGQYVTTVRRPRIVTIDVNRLNVPGDAVMLAALKGALRRGKLTVRQNNGKVTYDRKRIITHRVRITSHGLFGDDARAMEMFLQGVSQDKFIRYLEMYGG